MTVRLCSAVCAVAVTVACGKHDAPAQSSSGAGSSAPVAMASNGAQGSPAQFLAADLPPLPPGIVSPARSVAETRAAYEFAARHPEVLKHVPCFCGCERGGHQGNHDCFVASRDAAGKVTAWDNHGISCEVCIDVADRSRRMHEQGLSPADIRDAIDAIYVRAATRTPTPKPARGGHDH